MSEKTLQAPTLMIVITDVQIKYVVFKVHTSSILFLREFSSFQNRPAIHMAPLGFPRLWHLTLCSFKARSTAYLESISWQLCAKDLNSSRDATVSFSVRLSHLLQAWCYMCSSQCCPVLLCTSAADLHYWTAQMIFSVYITDKVSIVAKKSFEGEPIQDKLTAPPCRCSRGVTRVRVDINCVAVWRYCRDLERIIANQSTVSTAFVQFWVKICSLWYTATVYHHDMIYCGCCVDLLGRKPLHCSFVNSKKQSLSSLHVSTTCKWMYSQCRWQQAAHSCIQPTACKLINLIKHCFKEDSWIWDGHVDFGWQIVHCFDTLTKKVGTIITTSWLLSCQVHTQLLCLHITWNV